MDEPVCTQKAPYVADVEEGKTYYYCTCGKSAKQPFCDGTHKGSAFTAHAWTAEKTGKAYFCGCRTSKNSPLCDGAHKEL
jgi:CDGSH-type Zn-finger protein